MEEDRRLRRSNLDRLHGLGAAGGNPYGSTDRADTSPRFLIAPAGSVPPTWPDSAPEETGESTGLEAIRPIGASVISRRLRDFLAMDPTEKFDIQALNAFHFLELVAESEGDPELLERLAHRAQILLERVKQEVDDPLSAGSFLREQVLDWYRHSVDEPEWIHQTPERWAGIFADSRVSGGKLHPWLNLRLWSLRNEAFRAGRWSSRLRHGLRRDRAIELSVARTGIQRIQAETAQSILDDLATHRRDPGVPMPLVRLSELAVRREVQTVNEVLASLFGSPLIGPFVVLHPNRYPDCEELLIRPPIPGAAGAALAYALVSGRTTYRGAGTHGLAGRRGLADGPDGGDGRAEDAPEEELDGTSIWESESVTPESWRRLLAARRQEKRRLEAPPKEYRLRPAYPVLRQQLLEDGEFRKSFLAVKWRGRPAGLPLVVALLQKGSYIPDVATDHEYLEAELDELLQSDTQSRSVDGRWILPGWVVTRQGDRPPGTVTQPSAGLPNRSAQVSAEVGIR